MRQWLLVVLGLVFSMAMAEAGAHKAPRAKVREHQQHDRIADGVADGSLTSREAHRLVGEQKHIEAMAQAAAADGVVTPAEKAALERAQDKASAHIAGQSHDAQGASGPKPSWRVWDPGVNAHQFSQHLRIAEGILSGSLTAGELARLAAMEQDIRQMEAAMKSDGVLTVAERRQLHAALDAASAAIYAARHNRIARPVGRPSIIQLIDNGHLSPVEARELLAQVRRLAEILRLLAGAPLPPAVRHALEQEYAQLASQLFQ